jgi:hypothetical protein
MEGREEEGAGRAVAEQLVECSPDKDVVERCYGQKPHVDLCKIVAAKLSAAGVSPDCIERVPGCTVRDEELFFSYRRDGPRSGRHLAAIVAR